MTNPTERLALDPIYEHARKVSKAILGAGAYRKKVIIEFREALGQYRSQEHQLRFMDALRILATETIDTHRRGCPKAAQPQDCVQEKRYAELISAIQDELYAISPAIAQRPIEQGFDQRQADAIVVALGKLVEDLRHMKQGLSTVQMGQEVIYTDLIEALGEMAHKLPYGKRDWYDLLQGRIASVAVDETIKLTVIDPAIASLEKVIHH